MKGIIFNVFNKLVEEKFGLVNRPGKSGGSVA